MGRKRTLADGWSERGINMVDESADPPEETAYHLILVPAAAKSDTIAEPQKVCVAEAVGAAGIAFIVTATEVLGDSQPVTVWDAK